MELAWLLPATGFAIATAFTPGPNNTMVAASGANWGFARTLPHMFGVAIGFPVMFAALALGAGAALRGRPEIYAVLRWVGAAYLLWLAWQIASARPAIALPGKAAGRPFRFWQAAIFQWINPKAWAAAAGAVVTYMGGTEIALRTGIMAAVFLVVAFASVALWTAMGAGVARLLPGPRALRWFNLGMAALLVVSLVPLLRD